MTKPFSFDLKFIGSTTSGLYQCHAEPKTRLKLAYDSIESAENDFTEKGYAILNKIDHGGETIRYTLEFRINLPKTILINESEQNDPKNLK